MNESPSEPSEDTTPFEGQTGVKDNDATEDANGETGVSPPRQEIIERLEPYLQPGREEQAARIVQGMIVHQRTHRGPLPPAIEFRRYNTVVPGAADRILIMAENEQKHRHALETTAIGTEAKIKIRGQWFAISALILSLVVVTVFVALNHPVEGAGFGAAILLGVVAMFLGRHSIPRKPPENDND
ncbi:DUF2335 domain-containing protein [Phenylobacterium sp.]|uniref:DUF2335 domain-containing protein n=1 Tax=Phenylobacterium sp. TaxID=1871053 RepID=UPI0025D11C72|nr:DUF2335 domain-containing protein [Phenylobacterium sp.]MCA6286920.1 DUF2335 domain-containing protein [Phenylobacterium sp.]MCA6288645.1 DUF2335 domain-containing protein [Phenylobacterium sp.]MCA6310555.1 DUF2335 domain-containing protein [Phenylobacterium sp.]MCA6323832.1 DUF2335 domain-containing protein [Phenylobacterium sp.]MCA6337026.1 DUF2335 domain-containing protein [Phenylobacterium sp.]